MEADNLDIENLKCARDCADGLMVCNIPKQLDSSHLAVYKKYKNLSREEKDVLLNLFRNNMQKMYEETWGYNEREKKKELFSAESVFLIVYKVLEDNTEELLPINICAFAMFQYTWDDEDEPEFPVVYIFELQVAPTEQHCGIGKKIIEMLSVIAKNWNIMKLMLTTFKINESALRFYYRCGFEIDGTSPTKYGNNSECYEILSKKIIRKTFYYFCSLTTTLISFLVDFLIVVTARLYDAISE